MRFSIKYFLIIFTSSLVLSSLMYSFSVSPLNYAVTISRHVGNTLIDKINSFSVKDHYRISRCEVIHIGIVCAGYKYNIRLHTMLKSLYFYRSNPIHFHIMVDDVSKKIFTILFETWAVPQVAVTFYDVKIFVSDVEWVPRSKHYSGISALLKLVFPNAIPLRVTNKIIILDTDLTFNHDIYELWSLFDDFKQNQAIGLVEHQNDYYLSKMYEKHPWPALGRGFNTGLILYHLEHLKYINWEYLWTTVTKETIPKKKIQLPDQDIMNSVLNNTPSLLYNLPCEWNIQLTKFTDSYKCYENNKAKLIHWNSPQKEAIVNRDTEYFRGFYTMFRDYNGNLLRNQLHNCSVSVEPAADKSPDSCSKYGQALKLKRRTLLFLREFKHTVSKNDVTFVSQLSHNKLHILEELSKRWEGPISLTLYVTDSELAYCLKFIENSNKLKERYNIAYHAVFKEGDYYPINELRNIGLRNVVTPYVFLVDLDLIPMKGLYLELQRYIRETDMDKTALVVPAFESAKIIPQSKKALLRELDNKNVFPFHHYDAPQGHNQTDYKKWKTAKGPYHVQWAPYFEPYIVVKRNVVEYDPVFVGFGWNKVSHIMELVAQQYTFLVLTNAFVVHKNHGDSDDLEEFKKKDIFYKCVTNKMKLFVWKINQLYGTKFDTKTIL